jgi:UDP-glucose 4-epimerase
VNICSGIGHSPREIIDLLTEITGHRIEVVVNPAFVRANELRHLVGSNARLVALIGEQPAPALEETLRTMLAAA